MILFIFVTGKNDYAGKKDEYSYGPDKRELLSQDEGRKHPGGHRFRKGECVSLPEGYLSYAFRKEREGKNGGKHRQKENADHPAEAEYP